MKKMEKNQSITTLLRQKVEGLFKNKSSKKNWQLTENETLKLLHKLEVHQVALQKQNTELNIARSAAQEAAEKYAELYDFAPSCYFTLSEGGKIIQLNVRGAELLGKERTDLINLPFDLFVSDDTKPIFNHFLFTIFTGNTRETCEISLNPSGSNPPIDLLLTGISKRGEAQCMLSGVDITTRRNMEELLREKERFLNETQVIAQLGTYTQDITTGKWESSEVLDHIFGIGSNFEKTVEGWVSIIHPDWQKTMMDYFLNEVIGKKINFDKEYKIIRKSDKVERWVHGLGRLKFDANNQPVIMVGTIRDITEQKQALEAIKRSQLFLMSSLESFKNTIILFGDKNYRYLYFNKAHLDAMKHAYNKDIKIGMNILECFTSEKDRKSFQENYDNALRGESYSNMRIAGDIETAYYESFFNPIINDNNEIIGVTVLSMNITERKRAEVELEKWVNMFKPKAN